jgi:hypothetical protein
VGIGRDDLVTDADGGGKSMTAYELDQWRVWPRLLITAYMVVFYQTCTWFMSLPDPNNAQAGFVSVIVGAGAAWFGLYVNSGPKLSGGKDA